MVNELVNKLVNTSQRYVVIRKLLKVAYSCFGIFQSVTILAPKQNKKGASSACFIEFLLVEVRRVELLCECVPIHRKPYLSMIHGHSPDACPSAADLLSPKMAPKVKSMISAVRRSSPSTIWP